MKRNTKNWTMETKNCLYCSNLFTIPVWRKAKTCSYKCSNNLPKSRMKGKIFSKEHKEKIRQKHIGMKKPWASLKGELNSNYIKDRTKLAKRQERNDTAYREWRMNVWKRDDFKCKMENEDCDGSIVAHHILPWRDYVELRYEITNGITLCHYHHPRKRNEEANLSPYFQELVKNIQ